MSRISDHIRSNLWGITACFIAVMGAAVVASASEDGPRATKGASAKKQIKQLKAKIGALEGRLAAVEAKGSFPPSGAASGELSGSYPNPSIGTVAGLDLVTSSSLTGGINFGSDVHLYRESGTVLRTDEQLEAGSQLVANTGLLNYGPSQLGDATADETSVSGFLSIRTTGVDPGGANCDVAGEAGRLIYRTDTNELWVCDGSGGWLQILAS